MDEAAKNNESPAWQTDEFRIYEYKVKRCSRSRPHDWTCCPFAHNGEKAKRRDPRRFAYTGAACPDYRKNASCRRGDKCPFAHGVFESWLHPSRYRTQCCTDGAACKRRVCFFAHHESELRKPEDDPALLEAQLQAEALASTEQYQQILAAASLDMVAEASPTSSPGQLNLALLQALLQSSGANSAVHQPPVNWTGDNDGQERVRLLQLQNLLAALQLRNLPPQPPPQRSPSQSDVLSSLDSAALGRLLAANQALVQRQAEQEMLQRSSFEAARRNSISCDGSFDPSASSQLRPELRYTASDPFATSSGGVTFSRGQHEASQQAGARRMSMDNLAPQRQNGTGASQQGLDPRVLAALAMSQRSGFPNQALLNAQGRNAAAALRRSVDLGSLAHGGNLAGLSQHSSNSDLGAQLSAEAAGGLIRQQQFTEAGGLIRQQQFTEAGGRGVGDAGGQDQFAVSQAPAEAFPSAFASAFHQHLESGGRQFGLEHQQQQGLGQATIDQAAINAALMHPQQSGLQQQGGGGGGNGFSQMDSQGSEQLRRYTELVTQQSSGQLGGFGRQPSGQLSAQNSAQFGQLSAQASSQFGQPLLSGQSSARLGSIGAFLAGQGSGQLSSFGQLNPPAAGHFDMPSRQQPPQPQPQQRYSPGGHSLTSAGSMGRISEHHPIGSGMAAGLAASGWPSEGDASAARAQEQQQHQHQQIYAGQQQQTSSSSANSLKPPLSDEESARIGEELFGHPSGGSTPSQGPPTPCKLVGGMVPNQVLPSPRDFGHAGASSAYTGSPVPSSTVYDLSTRSSSLNIAFCSPPSIPEEGPAWAAARQLPLLQPTEGVPSGSGGQNKRMMPTLLEQLQFFDSQRNASAPLLDVHHPAQLMMARNTSFESLSAELPRSISDLNLAESQAAAPNQAPARADASGRR